MAAVTFSAFVVKKKRPQRAQMSFSLERKLSNSTQNLVLKIEENFEGNKDGIGQPKMTSSCIFQLRHVLGVILFLSFILTTLITKQQVITVLLT